jgi:hypothetical protein
VIEDSTDRFNLFFLRPEKLIENAMRKQGSIVMNLMTAPDCLATLDGTCFGSRLGKAVSYILTP